MKISEAIEKQFGSWLPLFKLFIESEQFDAIFTNLKMQAQAKRVIIPAAKDLFKSFEVCDRNNVKCVFFLMDPYPSLKDGTVIANGIPMDCSNTGVLQSSLQLFYDAIESDYLGFDADFDARPDISYLLREEGVLLMNTALSVEAMKVGSHSQLWLPFMKFFIEEVLNKHFRGLPVILAGVSAQKLEKYFAPMLHYIKKIEHPVAASYQNRTWNNDNCFKWCNEIIRQNNGTDQEIKWYRKKGEGSVAEVDLPNWVTDATIHHHETLPKAQDMGLPWRE